MMTPSPCFGPPTKTVLPGESLTWVLRISVPSRLTLILNSATFLCCPTKVISMMVFPSWTEIETGWFRERFRVFISHQPIGSEIEESF